MNFFKEVGSMLLMGARAHAPVGDRDIEPDLPQPQADDDPGAAVHPGDRRWHRLCGFSCRDVLGGKETYAPAFYSLRIFLITIGIGVIAGLITGCIGAGGGFVITPALMSVGIKGILAVGTDLFHIFAKAIMGSVLHRKLGNISYVTGDRLPGGFDCGLHCRRFAQPDAV